MKKTPDWNSSGPEGVHRNWIKNFFTLHERIAQQLNIRLETGDVPRWMTKRRTSLILKDESKGNIVTNFRPITCLPLMWRLLTGIIGEKVYNHLRDKGILPPEQKGERRGCRGIKDQLMVDKMILRNCRGRLTNLAVVWTDYTKAYDMVPHWWIIQCMK